MEINNPISKIKDPVKKVQVTKICKNLQLINNEAPETINEVIQDMKLPLAVHMFIVGNFSELMSLKYN
jgi:hypothetical protein